MKVLVWHHLPSGGGRRQLQDHVRALVDAGHHVQVVSPGTPATATLDVPPAVKQRRLAMPTPWERRAWAPLPPGPVLAARARAMDRHLDEVAALVRGERPDVVVAGACRWFRTVDLPRRLDVPAGLYLGEPYRWLYEALPQLPWARPSSRRGQMLDVLGHRAWRTQLTREVAAAATWDALWVASAFSREQVLRAYGRDCTVVRLGVDTALFRPGDGTRAGVVSVGALVPEKRPDAVLEAVSASPGTRLTWVANVVDPPTLAALESLAQRRGVTLTMHRAVSDAAVVGLLQGAEVFLYAARLEPFGYAPLEAGACGTPVVAVAEGGVRETILDGVTGVLVDSPADLGAALAGLLADPGRARVLGAAAAAHVPERWDRARAGAAFVRAAEQLAAR